MLRLAFAVSFVFVSLPAWSMSSEGPSDLHELIGMSDVIAVVKVTERLGNDFSEGKVRALVDQVVNGDLKPGDLITINEFDASGCAGPPAKYEVGQSILVLLEGNRREGFQACGNLYGARLLSDDQQAQCIKRIQEFYRIHAVEGVAKRSLFWAEWAVRCAEQPSTFADGLALLGRGTHFEFGEVPKPDEPTWYFPLLNGGQKRRLNSILERTFKSKSLTMGTCDLMRVISYTAQDKDLRRIALEADRELKSPKRVQKKKRRNDRSSHDNGVFEQLRPYVSSFIERQPPIPLNAG